MPIKTQLEANATGKVLAFPTYVGGSDLKELAVAISTALGVNARRPIGSPIEWLFQFDGYPDQFALWWDGYTCELGCSEPCDIEIDAIAEQLAGSGDFMIVSG